MVRLWVVSPRASVPPRYHIRHQLLQCIVTGGSAASVIFVPMIGATYIWNSFLARFSLERDRQRVAAFVPFLRRDVGWVIRASKKRK